MRESNVPIVATVVNEFYTRMPVKEKKYREEKAHFVWEDDQLVYLGEEMVMRSFYNLEIKTDDGRNLEVSVLDGDKKTKDDLEGEIKKGIYPPLQ